MNDPKISGIAALNLKDPALFRQQCYIDGKWADADSGKTLPVSNPATGEIRRVDVEAVLAHPRFGKELERTLSGLAGVNSSAKADVTRSREDRLREAGVEMKVLAGEHPVVRTHPETGRKALYVNFGHTTRFAGWSEPESAPLLVYLFAHQVRPEFTCRFHWEPGSLAFWDNRCAQHNPVNDYHGFRRVMHRVTLAGDRPR